MMERLTTDSPKDNIENSLNLFYIKNRWTWVRGCGPAPDYADMSLCDFVRMLVKSNIPDAALPDDDDDLSMMMAEWLMDEPDTAEGIISLLYTAGWAFAELRHRLAYYEDMEEQGRLVVLPCKVGDELFRIVKPTNACYKPFVPQLPDKAEPCGIYYKNLMGAYTYIPFEDFGKTVFLTREEAEQALAEKVYEQVQDAVDQHNQKSMSKIAAFLEQAAKEGAE